MGGKYILVNGLLLTYMATLDELANSGVLLQVKLKVNFERRKLYLCKPAQEWFMEILPTLLAFDPDDIRPIAQTRSLFERFVTGERLEDEEDYKLMKPLENDVYELRSPDTRFYGWFVKPSIFVVARADSMERVHNFNLATLHRREVENERARINLDEPKYTPGASKDYVFSF